MKHCGAHRQNLAIKACFYSFRAIKFFFEVVELLGRFFDFSNKRTAEYEEVQAELDEPQAKIIKSVITRWLSHDLATASLLRCFKSMLVYLNRSKDAQATGFSIYSNFNSFPCRLFMFSYVLGLYTNISKVDFLGILLLMRDILPILSILSKLLQDPKSDFSIIASSVPLTISRLREQLTNPGANYKNLSSAIHFLRNHGIILTQTPARNIEWLEKLRKRVITSLMDELDSAFPSGQLTVLSALFRVFNAPGFPASEIVFAEDNSFLREELLVLELFYKERII